ncbi:MAG: diacylglycerol/lipid kinase family protein [Clostridium sp.]
MKHLFIINPIAGKGKAVEYVDRIKEAFKGKQDEYEIVLTTGVGDATRVVKEKTSKDDYFVYSIGGDGTLNEVLNGMMGSKSVLAVIPSGSGNDFARTIYKEEFKQDLLEKIIFGKRTSIDVGMINNRYFLNISSVGFDAVVVDNARGFKKKKWISGSMAYLLGLIKTLFTFKPLKLHFDVNNEKFEKKMYLIAVANGKCYGGGLKIAPLADVNDGAFDIYAIERPRLHRLVRFLPRVLVGKDTKGIKEVHFVRTNKIRVTCEKDIIVNIDGELLYDRELNFEIIPKGIDLLVPSEALI